MRQPKPFFRRYTQTWYVQLDGRQINLGPNKERAFDQYHQLMANRSSLTAQLATVAELFEAYLDWCSKRRAPGTYRLARHYLNSFAQRLGQLLKISQLNPRHITAWMDAHPDWSDTTRHDAISAVQRALSWGIKQRAIAANPLVAVEDKPPRRRREAVFTPKQWCDIVAHVADEEFRLLLEFLRETGCRPQEARTLEARHVDLTNKLVLFPPSESKGKRQGRVIFLTDRAAEICRQLCARQPEGAIFRNRLGNAWTKDAINCRFKRLREQLNIPGMCAYAIRHTFATEGLKNGVDPISLATVMGHSDVAMLARTYQHLARDPRFLREQAIRARGRDA